jgi:hypothetical protein
LGSTSLFAFCPDCGQHNSLQILDKNFDLIEKILNLANGAEQDVQSKLTENALEDCVSAFDGFGRELCRIHANKASKPEQAEKISFQNLLGARTNVVNIFGFDISTCLDSTEWSSAIRAFQKRHLCSHKLGIIDQEYITNTSDPSAVIGHKISIAPKEVSETIAIVRKIAQHLSGSLPTCAPKGPP